MEVTDSICTHPRGEQGRAALYQRALPVRAPLCRGALPLGVTDSILMQTGGVAGFRRYCALSGWRHFAVSQG